jgi:MFS family permease
MKMQKNIKLLSLINFFIDFRLYAPIAILYFKEVTGSFMLGMAVYSVTSLASVFFEIPTGILSDRVGRKKTLTLGAVAGTLAILLYFLAPGAIVLMGGAVFEGLSRAFYSGNNGALLYDTLKEEGLEGEFHHFSGRVGSFFQIALALSALIGSLLAQNSFRLVMGLTVIFQALVIPVSLLIDEPPVYAGNEKASSFQLFKNALILFKGNRELRRVSFANLLSYGGGESGYQFQSAFINTLWPVWAIGIAKALGNGLAALSFWLSGPLIKRFGDISMMMVSKIYGRLVSLIALIFPSVVSPVLISSTSIFFGVDTVAADSYNHKHFSDSERATMGSIVSFVGALTICHILSSAGAAGRQCWTGKGVDYLSVGYDSTHSSVMGSQGAEKNIGLARVWVIQRVNRILLP